MVNCLIHSFNRLLPSNRFRGRPVVISSVSLLCPDDNMQPRLTLTTTGIRYPPYRFDCSLRLMCGYPQLYVSSQPFSPPTICEGVTCSFPDYRPLMRIHSEAVSDKLDKRRRECRKVDGQGIGVQLQIFVTILLFFASPPPVQVTNQPHNIL